MATRKMTVVREMTVGDGIGQRISIIDYDEETGLLIRPDERMTESQITEWNRIITILSNVGSEDFRYLVDGTALLDHCVGS